MRFLADMGISMGALAWLRQQGYDATHLREQRLQRLPNGDIFTKAAAEDPIILTFDMCARLTLVVLSILCLAPATAPAPTTQHNFARWEKEIAAYEQADRISPPASGAIVFTGSSTILRWKTLATDFPDRRVLNRGF